jgi:outer membrane protein assembly factor BamB
VEASGQLFICGSRDGYVYGVSAENGSIVWRYKAEMTASASPVVSRGILYFGGQDHNVHAIQTRTGEPLWLYETGGPVTSTPTVSDGVLYIGSSDHSLYALDAFSGALRWRHYGHRRAVFENMDVAMGTLYAASTRGELKAFR